MAKFGRIFWNNDDFINVFYNFGIYRKPNIYYRNPNILSFTMICVNLDICTVK